MSRPLAAVERGVAVVDPSFAATRTSSVWVEVLRGAGPDYERDVLVSLTLNAVPIDVLAERLNTTRGAVFKTLHDARAKLRKALANRGLSVDGH